MGSVNPTAEQLEGLGDLARLPQLTMINLLRFRERADYSDAPLLDPGTALTGRDAFERYMVAALPIAAQFGGHPIVRGSALPFVIGPHDERWDEIYLMQFPDGNAFLRFVGDAHYRAVLGHRTAAVADSRLIPLIESRGDGSQ
jgi:uncharacterized protein (DUF1330 family)